MEKTKINARIVADSINPQGDRITTFLVDTRPLNKQFNFDLVKQLKCQCGTTVEYSMKTVMSLFDIEYIECPYCNSSHVIYIEEFKIKENE